MDFEKFPTLSDLKSELVASGRAENATEAQRWIREHLPPEAHYQKKALAYLRSLSGVYAWKLQGGPYMQGGLPDIIAVVKGRFYGFEIKRPYFGRLSALQERTHEALRAAGAIVAVVSYVSEIEKVLQEDVE